MAKTKAQAGTKKRTLAAADTVTEGGARKKRKAAEDATAKAKNIVDDEDESDDELAIEVQTTRARRLRETRVEDMPLVARG